MESPKLYYPSKPFKLHQTWGIFNPIYQQFGFSRHNGIDFGLGHDAMLYAPCGGTVIRTGNQPNGGGIYLSMMTDECIFPDGNYRLILDFLHCDHLTVEEGDILKVGDVMAKADNTGFSTGPHTHMQVRRIKDWNGKTGSQLGFTEADRNDANNSIDPTPYWTGTYAQDYWTTVNYLQQLIVLLQRMLSIHSKA